MKFGFFSGQEGQVDLMVALAMCSGEYLGHRYRAGVYVVALNDDDTRKYGVEAWVYPRQVKFGNPEPYPAQVQIGGLSGHHVETARERLACYTIAICMADFVNRAAKEAMDLGKAEDSGLLWESIEEIQDVIDEAAILLTGEPTESEDDDATAS